MNKIRRTAALGLAVFLCLACTDQSNSDKRSSKPVPLDNKTEKLKHLYIPPPGATDDVVDLSGDKHRAQGVTFGPNPSITALTPRTLGVCGSEMVLVGGAFCIDRYESSLVDRTTGRQLSPHYPPDQKRLSVLFERWTRKAPSSGRTLGRNMPVPIPPAFTLNEKFSPRARSIQGQIPAGYMTRGLAEAACKNAGKRLCRREEWVRACRGERNQNFPYGDSYQAGVCNVYRQNHPARLLHGDSSRNHLDPRLLLTEDEQGPLLKRTGVNNQCVSRWGNDGIYDMVGNLDEWIDDPSGAFLGGFFSRATREGCQASIDSHSPGYLDYSLGGRCCAEPKD